MTEIANRSFVALTPYELPQAQAGIAEWCQQKVHALAGELRSHRADLRQARQMHWKRSGWERLIKKTERLMIYYTNIRKAVKAGYLVIPNFETEVVAVRVNRDRPKEKGVDYNTSDLPTAPMLIPAGQGRYVDDQLAKSNQSYDIKDANGQIRHKTLWRGEGYAETGIEFPIALVKPSILAATDRAMALRLFDRIGVVTGVRRGDPIVVGEIFHPDGLKDYRWRGARRVTFFIAWWLNSEAL